MKFIQKILGHKNLKTPIHFFKIMGQSTEIYTHITQTAKNKIVSPLDDLNLNDSQNKEKNES